MSCLLGKSLGLGLRRAGGLSRRVGKESFRVLASVRESWYCIKRGIESVILEEAKRYLSKSGRVSGKGGFYKAK